MTCSLFNDRFWYFSMHSSTMDYLSQTAPKVFLFQGKSFFRAARHKLLRSPADLFPKQATNILSLWHGTQIFIVVKGCFCIIYRETLSIIFIERYLSSWKILSAYAATAIQSGNPENHHFPNSIQSHIHSGYKALPPQSDRGKGISKNRMQYFDFLLRPDLSASMVFYEKIYIFTKRLSKPIFWRSILL